MPGDVLWLFGRGLSISCGLVWDDLPNCRQRSRDEKIECITKELRAAMDAPVVNPQPIRHFLRFLAERTQGGLRHLLFTTNWDFLLQREVDAVAPDFRPPWLRDSHVFHLNGTVENLDDNSGRSALVLREDVQRKASRELNQALNYIVWGSIFVVVGLAFECGADRSLFLILNRVQNELPSGESHWIVVNPSQRDIDRARNLIECMLPDAKERIS